jgi:hypothetical protein
MKRHVEVLNIPLIDWPSDKSASGQAKRESFDGKEWPRSVGPEPVEANSPLTDESEAILNAFVETHSERFGEASRRLLRARCEELLRWAEHRKDSARCAYEIFAGSLLRGERRKFQEEIGWENLRRERLDERRRLNAARSDDAMQKYLARWDRSIKKFRIAFPRRWRVPGLSDEELRAELQLRLLNRLRGGLTWEAYEKPGAEATYMFLDRERNAMRKRNRMYDATVTLGNLPATRADASPTPDVLVEREDTLIGIRISFESALREMSTRQGSWLRSFLEDVVAHGDLNEARVAELRGRDRSSACHAKRRIRAAILSKLDPALVDELGFRTEPERRNVAARVRCTTGQPSQRFIPLAATMAATALA